MATSSLCDLLAQMHLAERSAISLEAPDPEYVLHLDSQSCRSCGESAKLAASSTNQTVRVYTRSNLAYTSTIAGHENQITSVKFDKTDSNLLYTSSSDGTVRCWDIRKKCNAAIRVFEGYEQTSDTFSSFDVSSDGRVLCAGTEAKNEDVHLIFWDARHSDRLGVYSESHQDDITCVCFHPSRPDLLLSGSMDGLVCVYDISQSTEDDALLSTLNTESMVSRAAWTGSRDDLVYAVTTINGLHIWDTEEFDPVVQIEDINESCPGNVQMDYVVDCFHGDESDIFILAATHGGQSCVYRLDGTDVSLHLPLEGGHTDVVRCLTWDDQSVSLVTGGEDAMLCLWKAGAASQSQTSTDRRKVQSSYKQATKRTRLKPGKMRSARH